MSRVLKKLETGSDQFLGMIGFVGILVITANAFCRFVLRISMAWSDEFLRTIDVYKRQALCGLFRRGVLEISPDCPGGDGQGGPHPLPRGGDRHLPGRRVLPQRRGHDAPCGEAGALLRPPGMQPQRHGPLRPRPAEAALFWKAGDPALAEFLQIHKIFIDTPFTNGKHCAMITALALEREEC